MAITRVTQRMMTEGNTARLGGIMSRMSKTEEQLTTGKVLNRPSDSPTAVSASMRLRSSMSDQTQYSRNAQNGVGWLSQIDTTLQSVNTQTNRAYTIALAGANMSAIPQSGLDAYAAEVDQIRTSLISASNATYLDRPVFGGIAATGAVAYNADGTAAQPAAVADGEVTRSVAKGVTITVNEPGAGVFDSTTVADATGGTAPAGQAALFQTLSNLSYGLKNADPAIVQQAITDLRAQLNNISTRNADVGTRMQRLQTADQSAQTLLLSQTQSLSGLEDVDAAKAATDLQMQQTAYQVALATTAKSITPTLADFLS